MRASPPSWRARDQLAHFKTRAPACRVCDLSTPPPVLLSSLYRRYALPPMIASWLELCSARSPAMSYSSSCCSPTSSGQALAHFADLHGHFANPKPFDGALQRRGRRAYAGIKCSISAGRRENALLQKQYTNEERWGGYGLGARAGAACGLLGATRLRATPCGGWSRAQFFPGVADHDSIF